MRLALLAVGSLAALLMNGCTVTLHGAGPQSAYAETPLYGTVPAPPVAEPPGTATAPPTAQPAPPPAAHPPALHAAPPVAASAPPPVGTVGSRAVPPPPNRRPPVGPTARSGGRVAHLVAPPTAPTHAPWAILDPDQENPYLGKAPQKRLGKPPTQR